MTIPPFLDKNGRTCGLLLNAILFRYAGIAISLGEMEKGRGKVGKMEMTDGTLLMVRLKGCEGLAEFYDINLSSIYEDLVERAIAELK